MSSICLFALPASWRVILTAFLALIGVGYLHALANLASRHALADRKPELTLDDLRAVFHGLSIPAAQTRPAVPRSRMLEQIEPGGDMRKHLEKGGDEAIRALTAWLQRGAAEAAFEQAALAQAGDPSARAIIERRCLNCHNAESGEKKDAPYGPDLFEAQYTLVIRYAAPGTAKHALPQPSPAGGPAMERLPPQALPHIYLVAHIHMLSIPVFTLIVAGLYLLAGRPSRVRGAMAAVPMLMLVTDFSGWWLARAFEPAVFAILGAGAAYGVAIGWQLLSILGAMWLPLRRGAATA